MRKFIVALALFLGLAIAPIAPQPAHAVSNYFNVHYILYGGCNVKTWQESYTTVGMQVIGGAYYCLGLQIDNYGYPTLVRVRSNTYLNHSMPNYTTIRAMNPTGVCYVEYVVYGWPSSTSYRLYPGTNTWVKLW